MCQHEKKILQTIYLNRFMELRNENITFKQYADYKKYVQKGSLVGFIPTAFEVENTD